MTETLQEYPISLFTKSRPKGSAAATAPEVKISGNLPRIDLDDLPDKVTQRTKMLIVQGNDPDDLSRYPSQSEVVFAVACELIRAGCTDDQIAAILLDKDFGVSGHIYRQGRPQDYAARQIKRAKEKVGKDTGQAATFNGGVDINDDEDEKPPTVLAQWWLNARGARLIRFNGEWLSYSMGAYQAREDEGVRAEVWRKYPKAKSSSFVNNITEAAKGLVHLDKNQASPPCWLDNRGGPNPSELLVLRNGILDLKNNVLMAHTNELFTRNALDFEHDPNAPEPKRWLQFLREVWPEEDDCHAALQQMFGYLLTPDTSQQKIFVMVGPTRCGKGTIGRLLGKLLGAANICSPTLSSLSADFGQQGMIGKQLALVSDMRIGGRTDKAMVAETLLRISGEDSVSVRRKNMTDWDGQLKVRFVIMSNEAPTLNDPSGALLGRYIVLQMRQCFLGREDRSLDSALANELPGILNWAIEGWKSLRGEKLMQPASAEELAHSISRIGAPIAAFVEDECEIDLEGHVNKDDLFRAFKDWCREQDRIWHGNKETFSKDLLISCPYVKPSKIRDGGGRKPVYRGLKLRVADAVAMAIDELDLGSPPF